MALASLYRAVKPMAREELTQDNWDSAIPCKVVYTRKPPHGARRARIVGCGNHMTTTAVAPEDMQPAALSRKALYAGGADAVAIRIHLRPAALELWPTVAVDVRKAFLYAPLRKSQSSQRIFLRPQKYFHV